MRKEELDTISAIGTFISYVYAFGWLAVVLGIVGISLSAAIFCGCCKAAATAQTNPAQGVVVAQPAVVQAQPTVVQAQVVQAQPVKM